jgi:SPX domain protein involved in polyphosphate accumulation
MTIKDRIIRVLKKKGLDYKDLIEEINANENTRHFSETEADKLIENMDSGFLEYLFIAFTGVTIKKKMITSNLITMKTFGKTMSNQL